MVKTASARGPLDENSSCEDSGCTLLELRLCLYSDSARRFYTSTLLYTASATTTTLTSAAFAFASPVGSLNFSHNFCCERFVSRSIPCAALQARRFWKLLQILSDLCVLAWSRREGTSGWLLWGVWELYSQILSTCSLENHSLDRFELYNFISSRQPTLAPFFFLHSTRCFHRVWLAHNPFSVFHPAQHSISAFALHSTCCFFRRVRFAHKRFSPCVTRAPPVSAFHRL